MQEFSAGTVEKAQSVFCRGNCAVCTPNGGWRRVFGGGAAVKEGVSRPNIRAMLDAIGEKLAWHGALSIDDMMP